MSSHQSHSEHEKGQTDSFHKLKRLKLPEDLTGQSFLDVGCNEGFFCGQALLRNARKVVGIDFDEKYLNEASKRYSDKRASYIQSSWHSLPNEIFDIIVWSSAMHYELDPVIVLNNIVTRLSPSGLFVLECGVQLSPEKSFNYAIRQDNGHWYPTQRFIEDSLINAGLSFRLVSQPEYVGYDPVPRVVYHCRRLMPTVLIVVGNSGVGKTSLAFLLSYNATKVYSVDIMISRMASSKWAHNPLQDFLKSNYNPDNLGALYAGIDDAGLTDSFVQLLSCAIASSDKLVVIEGYLTPRQTSALVSIIKSRSKVWILKDGSSIVLD